VSVYDIRSITGVNMSITFLLLTVAPPLFGAAVGLLAGGRFSGFRAVSIRALWLVWAAAAVQFLQYFVPGLADLRLPLLGVVFALVLLWLALNLPQWPSPIRIAGLVIVLGAALNAVVIGLNGRMPYSPPAAASVGLHPATVTPKNTPAGHSTRLAALGDTIPVPALHKVASPGDVLISGGAAALVVLAMRRRTPPAGSHTRTRTAALAS